MAKPQKMNMPEDHEPEEEVSFQVMPEEGGTVEAEHEPEHFEASHPTQTDRHMTLEVDNHPLSNKVTYVVISILVLIILGALAYFLLGGAKDNTKSEEVAASKLPRTWLKQHFNVEVCDDLSTCGDDADPDNDGLINYDEYRVRRQSDPKNPDSDGDGLADGDEVHIYKTDPNAKYSYCLNDGTIACEYDDGSQIANDYDPQSPGNKMDGARKEQIARDIETYKLHEPTITTLEELRTPTEATQVVSAPQTHSVSITDKGFEPATITVKPGDSITWLNNDQIMHTVASDPHPTHTELLGLESGILKNKQSYTFKFETGGTYTYHDHLNPTTQGTVIVK